MAPSTFQIRKKIVMYNVPKKMVSVDDIAAYEPLTFTGQPFKVNNTMWTTTVQQYRDEKNAPCGYVEVTACVLECRADTSYEAQPTPGQQRDDNNNAFIRLHVPSDNYAKCYRSVVSISHFSGIAQTTRDWDEDGGTVSVEYCILSPKYEPKVFAKNASGVVDEYDLKDLVTHIARAGLDLLVTVIILSLIHI